MNRTKISKIIVIEVIFKKDKLSDMVLIGLFFLAFTSVHALYYVEARHGWAIEPLLFIFTASCLINIKNKITGVNRF